jgi:hypothetical protein
VGYTSRNPKLIDGTAKAQVALERKWLDCRITEAKKNLSHNSPSGKVLPLRFSDHLHFEGIGFVGFVNGGVNTSSSTARLSVLWDTPHYAFSALDTTYVLSS